jgi:hypothetical protein
MTDYRFGYGADFDVVHAAIEDGLQFHYVLQAVKPSRRASE